MLDDPKQINHYNITVWKKDSFKLTNKTTLYFAVKFAVKLL